MKKIKFDNNVFLAPMAGITDLPFRVLCKEQGAGLVYTEMVSAKGLMYESEKTYALLQVDEREHPVAAQIFGSDPDILAEMAKNIEEMPIDIIDINMGCPALKIIKNGEGSALMKNPDLIGEIVYKVSRAISKPLTIKIRKGFNEESINAVEVAKIAEDAGACAIAVHGRTRDAFYSGKADWDIIKKVKDSVKIPVIGNGDIKRPEDAKNMLDTTGCDAVMIGRASRGDPWIFKRTIKYLETGILLPEARPEEKIQMAIRHAEMALKHKGDHIGLVQMRSHLAWYIKALPGATKMRVEINKIDTFSKLEKALIEYMKIV